MLCVDVDSDSVVGVVDCCDSGLAGECGWRRVEV